MGVDVVYSAWVSDAETFCKAWSSYWPPPCRNVSSTVQDPSKDIPLAHDGGGYYWF